MLNFKHSLTLYDRKTENAMNCEPGCLLNFCKDFCLKYSKNLKSAL